MRQNYVINEDFFDIINNEEKAYLLGFFIADGCISIENKNRKTQTYRFQLSNSIDDEEIIKLYQKNICDNKLLYRKREKRKKQIEFKWSSKHMFDTMNNYNIHPRKTYDTNFKFPIDKIPKDLIRHFVRGFFDGDGNITFHRTLKSFQFNFSFIFTSLFFTNQIADLFKENIGIFPKISKIKTKNLDTYQLRFLYNRNRTLYIKNIYDWLYKDSLIYLNRKKQKFINYFEYRGNLDWA